MALLSTYEWSIYCQKKLKVEMQYKKEMKVVEVKLQFVLLIRQYSFKISAVASYHKYSVLIFFFTYSFFLLIFKKQSVRLISLCQRLSRSFLSRSNMSVARSDDTLVSVYLYA